MQSKEHRRIILKSVENGPLIWPTVEENGVTRTKKYAELSAAEKIYVDCDTKATNIILQGTSLTKHERECKLYDAFDKFTHIKGESLHKYFLRFTQLIKDMNIYNIKMNQLQVNTKFLSSLPSKWSKFVTDVKLVKDLHTTNFDQLHAYLKKHELHANEDLLLRERDDLIACLNKEMAFLTAIASSRFPSTNNPLRTSSNLRNHDTIQDDMQGLLNAITVKVKDIWLGNALSLSDQGMQHDPGVPNGQAVQIIIPNNAAFKTKDLDAYDSDSDDILNAKAVLMANMSNYRSDVISEEKANKEHNNESLTAKLERYKERVKTFEQRLNIDLSSHEKMIDSQMDDMIKENIALKEQVDSLA
nr:hypothetical protein [Tanacetum cinerariifolium]